MTRFVTTRAIDPKLYMYHHHHSFLKTGQEVYVYCTYIFLHVVSGHESSGLK
jgi:hypothetical protein